MRPQQAAMMPQRAAMMTQRTGHDASTGNHDASMGSHDASLGGHDASMGGHDAPVLQRAAMMLQQAAMMHWHWCKTTADAAIRIWVAQCCNGRHRCGNKTGGADAAMPQQMQQRAADLRYRENFS